MMRFDLVAHPSTPIPLEVTVEVEWSGEALRLRYLARGELGGLALPPAAPHIRADELWRSTCFELFLRAGDGSYREWNFSPSGQWAAYGFSAYRQGMRNLPHERPEMVFSRSADALGAKITLPVELTGEERIGLAAVLQDRAGHKAWFALAHPPGKPDFHHEACFAGTLPPIAGA